MSFGTDSKVDESKTFSRENTAQYDQCIYGIDNEHKAWEGDIKNQKNESDNLVTAKVHPILSQKEIVSIFTDAQGKPIFEDKEGLFYHEDESVWTSSDVSQNLTATSSNGGEERKTEGLLSQGL